MHRLACSGLSRPGQAPDQILDAMDVGTLLHFAYGEVTQGLAPEQAREVDRQLEELGRPRVMVERTLSDGRVVKISEARLERLRANARGLAAMKGKGA